MKKVICIESGMNDTEDEALKEIKLIEGSIYTVINSKELFSMFYKKSFFSYKLFELPGYHAACLFIPLSEIDETEMKREYNTVIKNFT